MNYGTDIICILIPFYWKNDIYIQYYNLIFNTKAEMSE